MSETEISDECPVLAVFSSYQYPCTLWRGHDGQHEFTQEPHPWPNPDPRINQTEASDE